MSAAGAEAFLPCGGSDPPPTSRTGLKLAKSVNYLRFASWRSLVLMLPVIWRHSVRADNGLRESWLRSFNKGEKPYGCMSAQDPCDFGRTSGASKLLFNSTVSRRAFLHGDSDEREKYHACR